MNGASELPPGIERVAVRSTDLIPQLVPLTHFPHLTSLGLKPTSQPWVWRWLLLYGNNIGLKESPRRHFVKNKPILLVIAVVEVIAANVLYSCRSLDFEMSHERNSSTVIPRRQSCCPILFEVALQDQLFIYRDMFQVPYRLTPLAAVNPPEHNQVGAKEDASGGGKITNVFIGVGKRKKCR